MSRPTRAFALRLGAIAVTGVVLRALYLFTIARHVTGAGDWFFYHLQANVIADGHGFADPYKLDFLHRSLPSAGHPPLYPLVLAAVSWLGATTELAHRVPGLALGGLTIVLVGLLGRRVEGERLGLLAAALCAVYPLMIAVDGALMSETLFGPLVTGILLVAYRLLERPGPWAAAGVGALIGLAALTRSEAVLFLPLLAWPVARRGGPGWAARAAVATLACAAVIAPWTIRNALAFGYLVPISTNDSTVLAGANCPSTYHGIDVGGWDFQCISPRRLDNEAAQAAIWRRQGLTYAGRHLGRLPVVAVVRFLRVWDLYQPRRQVMFAEGRQRRVEQAGVIVYYLLLVAGAAGALALRRRGRPLLVLLAPAAVVTVSAALGYGVPRLRHSFEMPLLALAAAGLLWAWDRRRGTPVPAGGQP